MIHKTDAFQMEQATSQDTEAILALLLDTAKWFKKNGSTQWNGLLEGIDTHHTEERIQEGDVFVCREKDDVAGMVMLLRNPSEWDRKLWGDRSTDNDAIYLHRIAINRAYANEGLGAKILNWAAESNRFEGKNRIRLDCVAQNEFLNSYYKKAGYTYIDEYDGYSLYEMMINE